MIAVTARRCLSTLRLKPIASALLAILICMPVPALSATYKDDIGYWDLYHQLGNNPPNGAGIHATQVESKAGESWMPDPTGELASKTFTDQTDGSASYSTHATGVAQLFYGDNSSIAEGISEIDIYEVNHWLSYNRLHGGFLATDTIYQPRYNYPPSLASSSRIANHSWVGTSDYTAEILRRLDFVVDADEFIQVVAMNNDDSPAELLGNARNIIATGKTDGTHSMGASAIDTIYAAGRVKPDIVVPKGITSFTTPIVAAAAVLVEAGHSDPCPLTDPAAHQTTNRDGVPICNAEQAEVVKAAMMAGAVRVTYNQSTASQITDYRVAATDQGDNGLDSRFGAGQINIQYAHEIIAAGEYNCQEDQPEKESEIGPYGFDFDPQFGTLSGINRTATYLFTADTSGTRLYAALVWNVEIQGGQWNDFDGAAAMHDFNLRLFDITEAGYTRLVAASTSTIDNSEHVWTALTPGRRYKLEVTALEEHNPYSWDYALAWRMATPRDTDGDGIDDDTEIQSGLDYTLAADALLDADGDGINNVGEVQAGTGIHVFDTDGDGISDGQELIDGSDPLNPFSTDSVAAVSAVSPESLGFIFLLLFISGVVTTTKPSR